MLVKVIMINKYYLFKFVNKDIISTIIHNILEKVIL